MSSPDHSHGFSLIEMMVAIAILGLALSIAVPSFSDLLDQRRATSLVEGLRDGLRMARQEAISHNSRVHYQLQTSTSGSVSWQVGCVTARSDCPAQLRSRAVIETGSPFTLLATPTGSTRLEFNSVGSRVVATDALSRLQVVQRGQAIDLAVGIGPGGVIRSCMPSISDPANPKSCP